MIFYRDIYISNVIISVKLNELYSIFENVKKLKIQKNNEFYMKIQCS